MDAPEAPTATATPPAAPKPSPTARYNPPLKKYDRTLTPPKPAAQPTIAPNATPAPKKPGFLGRLFSFKSSTPGAAGSASPPPPPPPPAAAEPTAPTSFLDKHAHNWQTQGVHAPAFKAWFGDWSASPHTSSVVKHPVTNEPTPTYDAHHPASKVIDPDGAPRVVFHGNPRGEVQEFKTEWTKKRPDSLHFGPGFYFTEDEQAGHLYAHGATGSAATGTPAVGAYYLKIHHPFDADVHKIDPSQIGGPDRTAIRAAHIQKALADEGISGARAAGEEFDGGKVRLSYKELTDSAGVGGYGASKAAVAAHLRELGHDGITTVGPDVPGGKPGGNRFWIAFSPTQVKSVHNRGTFDPHEAHTRKSLAVAAKPNPIKPKESPTSELGSLTQANPTGPKVAAAKPPEPAPAPTPTPSAPNEEPAPAQPDAPKMHPRVQAIHDAAKNIPITEKPLMTTAPQIRTPAGYSEYERVAGVMTPEELNKMDEHIRDRPRVAGDEESNDDEWARFSYLRDFYRSRPEDPRFAGEHALDQWGRDDRGQHAYHFRTSAGSRYTIRASNRMDYGKPIREIDFHDAEGRFKATGAGGAHEVFSKVTPALVAYAQQTKHPAFYFTAAEDSRQKLYDRLVKTLATALPEYAAFATPTVKGRAKQYLVVRRDRADEMREHFARGGREVEPLVKALDMHDFQPLRPATHDEIEQWHTPQGWDDAPPAAAPPAAASERQPDAPPEKLPHDLSPSDIARAILYLRAHGRNEEADYLASHLPPADPLAHIPQQPPFAPNGASPQPGGGGPAPGGLPAGGVPQPDNPASEGSAPPRYTKAYEPGRDAHTGRYTDKKFGCVYLLLPEPMRSRILNLARYVADADLADDGREDTPHCTSLFGLHHNDPTPVLEILSRFRPVNLELGKVSLFHGPKHDVLKIDVESDQIRRLNGELRSLPHTTEFKNFVPHITIAYVKPGKGHYYAELLNGLSAINGTECTCETAVFSDGDRTKTAWPLGRRTVEKAMSYLDNCNGGALVGPPGRKRKRKKYLQRQLKAALAEVSAELPFSSEEFVFGPSVTKSQPGLFDEGEHPREAATPSAPTKAPGEFAPKPAAPTPSAPNVTAPKPAPPPIRISEDQREALRAVHEQFPGGIGHLLDENGRIKQEHLDTAEDREARAAIPEHLAAHAAAKSEMGNIHADNETHAGKVTADEELNNDLNGLPHASDYHNLPDNGGDVGEKRARVGDYLEAIENSEFPHTGDSNGRPQPDDYLTGDEDIVPESDYDSPSEYEPSVADSRQNMEYARDSFRDDSDTWRQETADNSDNFRDDTRENLTSLHDSLHDTLSHPSEHYTAEYGEDGHQYRADDTELLATVKGMLAKHFPGHS